MNLFIRKILLYIVIIDSIIVISYFLIALNSNRFPLLEKVTFGLTNNFGKSYQRSTDYQNWKNQKIYKRGLILGSSTAYRNINPAILDSFTNLKWFNLGSTSQTLDISFELLKYAISNNKINAVILDIFIPLLKNNGEECSLDLIKNSILPTEVKMNIIKITGKNFKIINQFFYREIKKYINSNNNVDNYLNDLYQTKGFVLNNKPSKLLLNKNIQELILDYKKFDAIIKYCNNQNIQLFINIAPIVNSTYKQNIDYSNYIIYNQDFITNKTLENSFYDTHHLTTIGSFLYTHHILNKIKWKLDK